MFCVYYRSIENQGKPDDDIYVFGLTVYQVGTRYVWYGIKNSRYKKPKHEIIP